MTAFTTTWRHRFTRTRHGQSIDGLSPVAVAVGMVMSTYADWETGERIRPGHDRVAEVVGCSPATVKRSIAALTTAGWVECQERGNFGRASVYRLAIPTLVDTGTGELLLPVTGSRVTPLRKSPETRNGVTGAPLTGSRVTHHLMKDLMRVRRLREVAA